MENSKELLLIADAVSKEKGISSHEVLDALAEGMETALRRNFPEGAVVHVDISEQNGQVQAWRLYKLVDQIENVEGEMLHSEIEDEIVEDGYVWEKFEFVLNRQQFNITKQVALQRIKAESREHQFEELMNKPIALFSGIVKVVKKDQVIVDCSGMDITIFRRNMLPKDNYKPNDKVYFTLEKDKNQYSGTRISNEYLKEVFKREIVEIEEGSIEIVACARIPGVRAKVIVRGKNGDAVKTCVGRQGMHIKNIQNFLNGEIVDVIAYQEDKAQMLIKSLNPVNVLKILMDEDKEEMDICVSNDEIAQAIGRSGKNIEMISNLIGWKINVFSEDQWDEKECFDDARMIALFTAALNCDEEVASLLVDSGYTSLEEIAYLPKNEFYLEGVSEDDTESLRNSARETLNDPELLKQAQGIADLAWLGFTVEEQALLRNDKVFNLHDVCELSSYDLTDIIASIDEERAKSIVMKARTRQEKNELAAVE